MGKPGRKPGSGKSAALAAVVKAAATAPSKGVNTFLKNALAAANQTDDEKITEAVTSFVEDGIIEIETQISTREVQDIPKAELALRRTKQELDKAEKAFTQARFGTERNFEAYLEKRNSARERVEALKYQVETDQEKIAEIKAEVEEYKAILADFQATA